MSNEVRDHTREVTLGQIATQVAHDIRSPLAALDIVTIPEEQRILIRSATNRIHDIANNLLSHHKKKVNSSEKNNLAIEPELITDLILSVISEKRVQHQNSKINFSLLFQNAVYSTFANVSVSAFKRAFSNLLDNAIESLKDKDDKMVRISMEANAQDLKITIEDNGSGIPSNILDSILAGKIITQKPKGHGLGLSYAIKMIEHKFGGRFKIKTRVNIGTKIDIFLPKVTIPVWFVSKLRISPSATVVILDDDETIHKVWRNRLANITSPLNLLEFYNADELMGWHQNHLKVSAVFLIDYELIGDSKTGLDVIEQCNIATQSYLVTSLYQECDIRQRCEYLGIQLIPKSYAAHIPIEEISVEDANPDLIFIDDDKTLTHAWVIRGKMKNKNVVTFNSIEEFRSSLIHFCRKDMPIYIDSNFGIGLTGQDYAKELYEKGFTNIYLSTGYKKEHFSDMPWIKGIVGKEPPF